MHASVRLRASQSPGFSTRLEAKMMQAKGTFDIRMAARSPAAEGFNAMSMEKTYQGELQATAKGEFLSAGDPKAGNAGYVAIERITGTLAGHAGSFAVMQSATMATGTEPKLTATIVPGSGTGDLSGIYGSMTLVNTGSGHHYTVDYDFAR